MCHVVALQMKNYNRTAEERYHLPQGYEDSCELLRRRQLLLNTAKRSNSTCRTNVLVVIIEDCKLVTFASVTH